MSTYFSVQSRSPSLIVVCRKVSSDTAELWTLEKSVFKSFGDKGVGNDVGISMDDKGKLVFFQNDLGFIDLVCHSEDVAKYSLVNALYALEHEVFKSYSWDLMGLNPSNIHHSLKADHYGEDAARLGISHQHPGCRCDLSHSMLRK